MARMINIALMISAVDRASAVIRNMVNAATTSLDKLKSKADKIGQAAMSFGKTTGAMGLAVGAPIVGAVKAAADMERMSVALKTAFRGNAAEAAKAMKVITAFAAKTPYDMEQAMSGFIKLKNLGLDPTMEAMESFGNTSSSMGKSLNDMVEAVADASTFEFERLKEFGIRAKQAGDSVVFTFQGVDTKVKKNADAVKNYLIGIGNTKFAGGMEAQSKTIYGQMSTLQDNFKQVAATLGNVLIPSINALFARITPVIENIQKWVNENPRLAKIIVITTTVISGLLLALSALGFMIGGIMNVVSVCSTVFSVLSVAIGKVGLTTAWTSKLMMAAPWILAIAAIAAAAYLIYRNWDLIKAFFIRLWAKIKEIFWKVVAWVKEFIWYVHPALIIYKHWGAISAFFVRLWGKVKEIFMSFLAWLRGIHMNMYNAGVNIVKSIWNGIKSFAHKPIEAIKDMVGKIRDHLPFSPAKVGPLRDIHRIKLVETIAASVKPDSLVKAMRHTAQMAFNVIPQTGKQALPSAGSSNRVSIHYNPVIQGGGAGGGQSTQDIKQALQEHSQYITKMVTDSLARKERTRF